MVKKIFGIMILSSFFALNLFASGDERFEKKQENQEKRIQQGIQSGSITSQEAERLQKQQQRIDNMEEKAKVDGVVTKQEAHKIMKAQDNANKNIYNKKHNPRRN